MLQSYQKTIIGLLIKQETVVSQLYTVFAEQFSKYREFWLELSQEEVEHAKWLRRLYAVEKQRLVVFQEDNLKMSTVKNLIRQVEQFVTQSRQTPRSLLAALNFASQCEEVLNESLVLAYFTSPIEEIEKVLTTLRKETQQHREKLAHLTQEIRYKRR